MALFAKKQVLVRIEAKLEWKVMRDPESGAWIGACPALNLNAVGDTWIDFQQCADETLDLLLRDLFNTGELHAFLREHGWRSVNELPPPGTHVRFDVPFETRRARFEDLVPAGA